MKSIHGLVFGWMVVATSATAQASSSVREAGVAVDVVTPLSRRYVTLEWDATQLILDRYRGLIVGMPIEHHALVLSGYYAAVTTAPIGIEFDPNDNATAFAQTQRFTGGGGEIGYRYYTGLAGPQGFFAGPSFLWSKYDQRSGDGSSTSFSNRGVAVDVGFETLVAQRIAFSLAAGVQWTATSISLPQQLFPADWLVNEGFRPRFQLSVGVAL